MACALNKLKSKSFRVFSRDLGEFDPERAVPCSPEEEDCNVLYRRPQTLHPTVAQRGPDVVHRPSEITCKYQPSEYIQIQDNPLSESDMKTFLTCQQSGRKGVIVVLTVILLCMSKCHEA